MPSTAAPFGLKPVSHPSGTIRSEAGTILTGYATSIKQYAPVRIAADGSLEIAAAGTRAVGVFMGVEYTDTNGRPQVANQWVANQAGTNIVAYFTRDPLIRYEIQSSAAIALADMGSQADWGTATAGSTVTGLSAVVLDAATLTSSGSAGLRILGLGKEVDNAWDDTYCNVIVGISEHQDVADIVAY